MVQFWAKSWKDTLSSTINNHLKIDYSFGISSITSRSSEIHQQSTFQ